MERIEGIHYYFKKDGKKITVGNIKKYTEEHGLRQSALHQIKNGHVFESMGYTCHTMWEGE